jgi:hypothetical protein
MKMKLMITALGLFAGTMAHAEPYWACNLTLGEQTAVRTFVQAEMEPGSTIPDAVSNRNGRGSGSADGGISYRLADGRTIDLGLTTSMEFTGKFDMVSTPFFNYALQFTVAERGQELNDVAAISGLASHYVNGYMTLNKKDLTLKQIIVTEGGPTADERKNDIIASFFCAPHFTKRVISE